MPLYRNSIAFNDPLFPMQWHLQNTGQLSGARLDEDINVVSVWPDYTGRGVSVGVLDDGFDATHPDLVANYKFDLSWDFVTSQKGGVAPTSKDSHGTAVAGLIASSAHNGLGGVGVAWDASLIGYRILGEVTAATIFGYFRDAADKALTAGLDVLNNSWGPMQSPFDNQSFQSSYLQVARDLASLGRGGLGTVSLFSAGNDREVGGNTNYDPTDNLPYAITVAASDVDGRIAYFSTPGASVLVAAPGSTIFSTDLQSDWGYNKLPGVAGNYVDTIETSFSGTSAAGPIAAGVVALMLDANPRLGYRDVQEILAYSARRAVFLEADGSQFNKAVNWNGGGLLTSDDFGFGNIDAHDAIRLAETWQKTSTVENLQLIDGRVETRNFSVSAGREGSAKAFFDSSQRIEQIAVSVDLQAARLEDVIIELISPLGTTSLLSNKPFDDEDPMPDNLNYTFNTVQNWGETLQGEWTLRLVNGVTGSPVTVNAWSIKAYAAEASVPDAQIFTNEFAAFVALDASRTGIDARDGTNLNASAVTHDSILDLSGGISRLGDATISLSDPAGFRNLFAGDGNDRLIGNSANNLLLGGRGDNFVDGGQGVDVAAFIADRSRYDVEQSGQGLRIVSKGLSGGGTDIILNVEKLQFVDVVLPTLSALNETQTIANFYDALFDRAPDVDGLKAWVDGVLSHQISEKDVAIRFTRANEQGIGLLSADAYLTQLYRSALEREPDLPGYQGWLKGLASGQFDRGDVLLAFVRSSEYQATAVDLVAQDLSRLGNFWD
jgi:subtilisin family serine protease